MPLSTATVILRTIVLYIGRWIQEVEQNFSISTQLSGTPTTIKSTKLDKAHVIQT